MYSKTFTGIKLPNGLTDLFEINRGIRQGDGLSPLLFCLYIDDLKNIFDDTCHPCTIGTIKLNHLLYADDLILFSETKHGLQNCLDKLNNYCKKWKLKINLTKTKIMIFRPSGRIPKYTFNIDGKTVEIVTSYKYLGITISSNGSFKQGIIELIHKAQKAWYSLRTKIHFELWNNPVLILKLFDSMVRPIMTYASEVWCQQFPNISNLDFKSCDSLLFEKLHNKICKQVLGVNKYSMNLASRLELGRKPISIYIVKQMFKYLKKLENEPTNSLLYNCLQSEKELHSNNIKSWYSIIDNENLNVTNVNNIGNSYEENVLKHLEMASKSTEGCKVRTYAKFKTDTKMESYLKIGLSRTHKRTISKFRIGNHKTTYRNRQTYQTKITNTTKNMF
jgi:hypothetical protein